MGELQPDRDLSRNPLFQVTVAYDASPAVSSITQPDSSKVSLVPIEFELNTRRFDLELHFLDREGRLQLQMVYAKDLFDPPTIERLAVHLEQFLTNATASPDRRLSDVPLTDAHEESVLREWSGSSCAVLQPATLSAMFEEQAARTPNATAVTDAYESLTYAELNRRANQLAHHLCAMGAGPETVVAVCLPRSTAMVTAILGILKSGAAYLPMDPAYPTPRLAYMLEDSRRWICCGRCPAIPGPPIWRATPLRTPAWIRMRS